MLLQQLPVGSYPGQAAESGCALALDADPI